MKIDDQIVLLQENDCLINATQILKLCSLTQTQRKRKLKALKNKDKVKELSTRETHEHMNAWIDICEVKALCKNLKIEKRLQSLMNHELSLRKKSINDTNTKRILSFDDNYQLTFANESENSQSFFIELVYNTRQLAIRRSN